ncbi:MAG: VCBS repeat-containing protein [Planctomycetota bacterium]
MLACPHHLALAAALAAASCQPHVHGQEPTPPRFELAAPPLPVGPMAGLPEAADVNHDGHLDVVVACGPCCGMDPSPDAGHVQILLGDGAGRLRYAGDAVPVGETALRVAIGDVNGDGHADVASIQHSSYDASVILGDGLGGFATRPDLTFPLAQGDSPHVHSVTLADVNHDGHLDFLATLISDHAIAVHLGDGKGHFRPALGQPYFAHRHPYEQLTVCDLNGDGHPDLACTDVRGNGITVLVGSGTGMFAPSRGFRLEAHTPIAGAERPTALALGDFTGDGCPDVVATIDESPQVVVLANDGHGEFQQVGQEALTTAQPTYGVRVADLNGDGRLDFVTGGAAVSLGHGDGTFAASRALTGGGTAPQVAIGDFDGDGRPDIVCSSYSDGTVAVLLNRPDQ